MYWNEHLKANLLFLQLCQFYNIGPREPLGRTQSALPGKVFLLETGNVS